MGEKEIQARVQAELSPYRYAHTVGVVTAADELARRYGLDVEKARLAAWIHDIAREWPLEELLRFAERVEIPAGFASISELLHGPIAAHLLTDWFHIDDVEIANAIRFHTTGRLGMSKLEMVLCLADAIEPGRSYAGVEHLRELSRQNLSRALAESLDSTIRYLLEIHEPVFPLTVMARNELWEQVKLEVAE